jgi:hypothetical protein
MADNDLLENSYKCLSIPLKGAIACAFSSFISGFSGILTGKAE